MTPSDTSGSITLTGPPIVTSYVYEMPNSTVGGTSNMPPAVTAYATSSYTHSTTDASDRELLTSDSAIISSVSTQASNSSNPETQIQRVSVTDSLTPTASTFASNSSNAVQTGSVVASNGVVQAQSSRPLMMTYYAEWAGTQFPPEKVDFGRFDWIDFAFGVPNATFDITFDGPDHAADLLSRLVAAAHTTGTKIKLSVGGWTGSK